MTDLTVFEDEHMTLPRNFRISLPTTATLYRRREEFVVAPQMTYLNSRIMFQHSQGLFTFTNTHPVDCNWQYMNV
jgi:hypothetical protein